MTTTPETIIIDPVAGTTNIPDGTVVTLGDLKEPDATFDPMAITTCDRVRDLMADDPEYAGKVILTCDKPLGHDRRGPHRMRNDKGVTTCTWWGAADND